MVGVAAQVDNVSQLGRECTGGNNSSRPSVGIIVRLFVELPSFDLDNKRSIILIETGQRDKDRVRNALYMVASGKVALIEIDRVLMGSCISYSDRREDGTDRIAGWTSHELYHARPLQVA